jgi:hypothetical protein
MVSPFLRHGTKVVLVARAYNRFRKCLFRRRRPLQLNPGKGKLNMTIPLRTMRVSGLAVWAMLLLIAAALGAQSPAPATAPSAQGWKTYTYTPDGFSVSMPSEPDIAKRNVDTDAGSFELRSYTSTDGDTAMFVGVCDYGSKTESKDPNTLLQGAKKGALENSKSQLVSEKQITFGIYPGLTFEGENDQIHFTARFYMVGSTLYETLVVYPLGKPYANAARFLDSFQMTAHVQG